jgi:GTP-binding nuclear protein Ran
MALAQYKIVLVGDGCVGKTTWVYKLVTASSPNIIIDPSPNPLFDTYYHQGNQDKYLPTLGVDVDCICIQTNIGLLIFNIWDCAGQDKYGGSYGGSCHGYYIKGDGAIIMYDSTNQDSEGHLEPWTNDVHRVCSKNNEFPTVHVATKCDNGIYPPKCIGISAKHNLNMLVPLLELVRKIRNDNTIVFL